MTQGLSHFSDGDLFPARPQDHHLDHSSGAFLLSDFKDGLASVWLGKPDSNRYTEISYIDKEGNIIWDGRGK